MTSKQTFSLQVALTILFQFFLLWSRSQLLNAHGDRRRLLVLALLGVVIFSFHRLLDQPVLVVGALALDLLGRVIDAHSVDLAWG